MEELQAWTQIHNIKTLSVAAWWALDLVTDIERRKTHMLVLILSRTKSSNPVTFYELVEAQVVDTPQLKRMYKNMSTSPRKVLRPWEEHYRTSGHIGAMMLLTFEQMPGTKLTVADLLPGLASPPLESEFNADSHAGPNNETQAYICRESSWCV